jgi:hypothetical protein
MDPFPRECWQRLQDTMAALRAGAVNGSVSVQLNLGKGQVLGWGLQVVEHCGVSISIATSSS